VLLIFDEIPTGLGKTERMFSCEHDGVAPDILVIGKGLGGGILPIAAVIADPSLDVGCAWAFGHYTHEKNPVTTRAALETIRIIADEDLVANAERVGTLALTRLDAMMDRCPSIGDVRGRGCLIGIELVRDRATREPDADLAEAVLYRALDAGLSFKTTHGQCADLDATAHRHPRADGERPRHRRGGHRECGPGTPDMTATMVLLDRAGWVALLLWGIPMIRIGMQRAFGGDLRRCIPPPWTSRIIEN
jgi:hypothetical protein